MKILIFFILIFCARAVVLLQFSHIFNFMTNLGIYKNQLIDTNGLPTIYAITPTYYRLEQEPVLIRLSQTLLLVPNLHWIVVERGADRTNLVSRVLEDSDLKYTHLCANKRVNLTSRKFKKLAWWTPQLNMGLEWLRENLTPQEAGVVYFMLEDSTYSLTIFEEMSFIKTVGIWPIEIPETQIFIRPRVDMETRKVTGFDTNGVMESIYPISLTMFAVNLRLLLQREDIEFDEHLGYRAAATAFLELLTTLDDLEPLASLCTEVYVWSTRTVRTNIIRTGRGVNHKLDREVEL